MKTRIFLIICLITGIAVHLSANEKIYINREVTTHIVMVIVRSGGPADPGSHYKR